MQGKIIKVATSVAFWLMITLCVFMCVLDIMIPDRQSFFEGEPINKMKLVSYEECVLTSGGDMGGVKTISMTAKLFGKIPLKTISCSVYDKSSLYVGGFPFGVRFFMDGVVVVGFRDIETDNGAVNPAYDSGLRVNDIIKKCGETALTDADSLTKIIEKSNGKPLNLTISRDNKEYNITLSAVRSKDDDSYKTGMFIKDSGAGIGTVTYINPADNSFGGLGHGICDSVSGKLIAMKKGSLLDVTLNGITKGVSGTPGELRGSLGCDKLGAVTENTDCGVFGVYTSLPSEADLLYPIGLRGDVHEGEASVFTTVDGDGRQEYSISISAINRESTGNKCFTVKITDEKLLQKTGGIIQGMSGSPIIQDGKIIGAITHVMVGDPTTGYGIFIENMLETAA